MSEDYLTRKARFEVYCWQYSNTGSFSNMLLDLFGKADSENRIKLGSAFPHLFQAYCEWRNSDKPSRLLGEWKNEMV